MHKVTVTAEQADIRGMIKTMKTKALDLKKN